MNTGCYMLIYSHDIVQAQTLGAAFERCLAKRAVYITQHLYSDEKEMLKKAEGSTPDIAVICCDDNMEIVTELRRQNTKLKIIILADDNQSAVDSFDLTVFGLLPMSPSDTQIETMVERLLHE